MLSSKEVLEKTGISRATLNNYIASGIVPRPEVLPPGPSDGAAPRMGYFPPKIVERIEEIQRLKREGWSITQITAHFTGAAAPQAPAPMPAAAAQPDPGIGITRSGPPALTQVAVLVTDLQQSARLWAELPPEEYFELVNDIWLAVDPIFERHHGIGKRHPGEGMVCYFLPRAGSSHLPNALAAAREVREGMRRVSRQWQSRKGWTIELFMNTGIAEGQEWHGQLRPGPRAEYTVLGDAANHAVAISSFARDGAVWITRDLVGKLRPEEQARLKFGVRRRTGNGDEVPVTGVFSRVENLADLDAPGHEALRAIARLPITEVLDFGPPPDVRK